MSISSFFYKNETLSEDRITIGDKNLYFKDIGLYTFSKHHNFEYNHISFTNKISWDGLILDTLCVTFLGLIYQGIIDIKVVNYVDSYFNGLRKVKRRRFQIELNKEDHLEDLLSKKMIKALSNLSKANKEVYVNELIIVIFDKYIGERKRYLSPDKKFLLNLLQDYVKAYNWLKLEEDYHLLGTHFKYKIKIDPIYIPPLKLHHKEILDFHLHEIKENILYRQLMRRIKDVIEFNLKVRDTLLSSSNNRHQHKLVFPIPSTY